MDERKINIDEAAEEQTAEEQVKTDKSADTEETAAEMAEETAETATAEETKAENSDEAKAGETDPLQQIKEEVEVLKDKFLRQAAEFDNFRKRTIKEKAELTLNGSMNAVKAILPVLDDMERAIANGKDTDDPQVLRDGMVLIFKKFEDVLGKMGVRKIDTENADFDTEYHEAIAMVPGVDDDKKGKVVDCVQTGYTLNDKVIRHAKVAVGQ